MNLRTKVVFSLAAFMAAVAAGTAHAQTPYAGQQTRAIKALAAEEIQSYETGKGMGFAKAAELNGYPGPLHVLELAPKLGLSEEQRRGTEAIFQRMQTSASALGRHLVAAERELDAQFAGKTVKADTLAESLRRIGELHAQIRLAHLEAHLEQVDLLSPAQVARYGELRGYGGAAGAKSHAGHH